MKVFTNEEINVGNQRLLALAVILDQAGYYDQTNYRHGCGSPACAMGYWDAQPAHHSLPAFENETFAITKDDRRELFGFNERNRNYTARQASEYIRAFVARRQPTAQSIVASDRQLVRWDQCAWRPKAVA